VAFVALEKAFDRVSCKVVWWALRSPGVDEWLVSVVQSMYEDATTVVRVHGRDNKAFGVRVGVHQVSVLSLQLFVMHSARSLVMRAWERPTNGAAVR